MQRPKSNDKSLIQKFYSDIVSVGEGIYFGGSLDTYTDRAYSKGVNVNQNLTLEDIQKQELKDLNPEAKRYYKLQCAVSLKQALWKLAKEHTVLGDYLDAVSQQLTIATDMMNTIDPEGKSDLHKYLKKMTTFCQNKKEGLVKLSQPAVQIQPAVVNVDKTLKKRIEMKLRSLEAKKNQVAQAKFKVLDKAKLYLQAGEDLQQNGSKEALTKFLQCKKDLENEIRDNYIYYTRSKWAMGKTVVIVNEILAKNIEILKQLKQMEKIDYDQSHEAKVSGEATSYVFKFDSIEALKNCDDHMQKLRIKKRRIESPGDYIGFLTPVVEYEISTGNFTGKHTAKLWLIDHANDIYTESLSKEKLDYLEKMRDQFIDAYDLHNKSFPNTIKNIDSIISYARQFLQYMEQKAANPAAQDDRFSHSVAELATAHSKKEERPPPPQPTVEVKQEMTPEDERRSYIKKINEIDETKALEEFNEEYSKIVSKKGHDFFSFGPPENKSIMQIISQAIHHGGKTLQACVKLGWFNERREIQWHKFPKKPKKPEPPASVI